jgi:polar amino acid transport system substrate-binding protein
MMKECGKRLGFKVVPELTQWDSQMPGLQSKRWDAIAAGMSVSDERLQVAIATQPLYTYGARVLVEKGNPLDIHSWDDIADSGEKVGMVSGGFYQPDVEALGISVVNYDSLDAEIADLEAGRIKIVANAETSLTAYVKDHPDEDLEVADPWDYQDIGLSQRAWFFNKSETSLRDAINGCVTDLKDDGTMKKLLGEFGFNPDGVLPDSDPLP